MKLRKNTGNSGIQINL